MADLFRKTALDKFSSPDQLDRQIKLVSPSFWIAVAGGGLILAVALIWSIFGRLPVNVSAGGIYMGASGINSVIAEADGVVQAVYVSEGDKVSRGQELVQLDSSVYDEEIAALQRRRDDVDSVSFWSSGDPATADTKPLLDIKAQLDVSDVALTADQISLRERENALAKQKKAASKAKSSRNSAKKSYERAQTDYLSAQDRMNEANDKYNAAVAALDNAVNEGAAPEIIADLMAAVSTAKDDIDKASDKVKECELSCNNAQTAYTQAQQKYSTELAAKKTIADTVSQLRAKVKADKNGAGSQTSSLEKQFDSAKGSILDQIDQELGKQQRSSERMQLKSRADGRVTGLNISEGNAVQMGMVICRVASESDDEEVILYVPVSEGKKIKKDMKAVIYPSTVNRQEYGHIQGSVTGVSDGVVSAEEMLGQLGEQSLVQAYQQSGPVIRVTCSLEKDKSTASGYKWSSRKGSEVELDEGTVVSADIVTEEKAPITMLIPLLKEKLSVSRDADSSNTQESSRQQ